MTRPPRLCPKTRPECSSKSTAENVLSKDPYPCTKVLLWTLLEGTTAGRAPLVSIVRCGLRSSALRSVV